MKKTLLLIAILFAVLLNAQPAFCQDENETALKEAVASLDSAYLKNDFKLFMENHSFFERLLSMNENNYLVKYYLAYTEYRLFTFKFSNNNIDVEKYYDTALEICKDLIAKNQFAGEAKTVMASLYMMRLATNQMEAMALAPQIYQLIGEAESEPGINPRALIIKGIMLINTPPMFGGSVEKGIDAFTTAVSIYETNKKEMKITWGYEETLAWLGQALEKNNQPDKALETYKKALKTAPDFSWVKFVLLPALVKTNKQ